ncbi:TPA: GNAT family N-acetyltransferase [Pseudomonas aeruginosa]|uniref:GNAT family N-acetyltransferase n=1 Tax=Pseudomonas TaxID=286 RepID=UPI001E34AD60|nr:MULTISPECIES: GNAT family N-acetyltransferase [Pseudomonas]
MSKEIGVIWDRLRQAAGFFRGIRYVEPEVGQATSEEIEGFTELLQIEAGNGHFTGPKTMVDAVQYVWELQAANEAVSRGKPAMVTTYAVRVQGQAIGLCVLRATENAAVLDLNVVLIKSKWRKRGFGRYAIDAFRTELASTGRRMLVRCMPASAGMISLLQQMGFEEVPAGSGTARHFLTT